MKAGHPESTPPTQAMQPREPHALVEVLATFLKLGLTSFGGPIAHLGYFHREIVMRRQWVDESSYAQLVALCQFLPGPASSQLGFSLGLLRAGWPGALVAFLAFTAPSVLLLSAFTMVLPWLDRPAGQAAIDGLKLAAVAIVAQSVVNMAQRLTPDWRRRLIAISAASLTLFAGTASVQLVVVVLGALAGLIWCRSSVAAGAAEFRLVYGTRTGAVLLIVCALLLATALLTPTASPLASIASGFFRAGALVFGGGHVVLPLLYESVVPSGLVSPQDFLAGYGMAQVVPGPMFSLAAFLGARAHDVDPLSGASVGLIAIFLPGFLLVAGTLPFWRHIAKSVRAASAVAGINASVVGLLAAALYDPVWTSAVKDIADVAIVAIAFVCLMKSRLSPIVISSGCVVLSLAVTLV